MFIISESQRTFTSFFIFGLLNNILYVIILSAAIDLVGPSTPKAIVLLSDVLPSFLIKLFAPFFIHRIPYLSRIYCLIGFSSFGMLLLSLSPNDVIFWKILGIASASLSSGMGEVSFLQLTHYFNEVDSIGGFSSGTGGAGLFGSFFFMIMTNLLGIPVWIVLLLCSVLPVGFVVTYFKLLPLPTHEYEMVDQEDEAVALDETVLEVKTPIEFVRHTMSEIKPLVLPYMVPLTTVYISEYVINQGISPTLLFPLDDLPHWLFSSYRDIYVVYGFLYQLGVFISRSSISFGIRIKHLYSLSVLQFINVLITLCQSIYDSPFSKIWLLLVLIFYEGLLGGASYVNTYKSVSEEVPRSKREFSMGSVSISDSLGIVLAGCINWWLEVRLCNLQVSRGRDWCMKGGSI